MLKQFIRLFGVFEDGLACSALALVVFSVVWGIASRILPMEAAVWSTELSGLAFTWVTFVGASAAFRRGLHVSVPVLTDRFPKRIQRFISVCIQALLIAFLIYALYLSIRISAQSFNRPSPVLRIPFVYIYAALVVSFLSMSVTAITNLYRDITSPDHDDLQFNENEGV